MAIITEMLGEKVISGFKGTLDYYYWMGIPCVRKWPRSPGHRRAPAVQTGWAPFTSAVKLWNQLPLELRDSYQAMSSGSGLTSRDLFMRSYMAGVPKLYDFPHVPASGPISYYWAITEYWKEETATGWTVYVRTDVPCHLWLCFTEIRPKKHLTPVLRRGLWMHADPTFCFVAYECVEEVDAGDNLVHQFNLPAWQECVTRWFTFWGTIAGFGSVSTAAIFKLHWGPRLYQCEGTITSGIGCWQAQELFAIFQMQKKGWVDHLTLRLGWRGEPTYAYFSLNRVTNLDPLRWEGLRYANRMIDGVNEWSFVKWFTFQFARQFLGTNTWYALRLWTYSQQPVEIVWPQSVFNPCPNSFSMIRRRFPDRWFTLPNNDFYFTLRGEEAIP